jgi:hypothetical protein
LLDLVSRIVQTIETETYSQLEEIARASNNAIGRTGPFLPPR